MAEIKKRKIVLASVLKPVDDSRMAEKMAQSLALTKQFEIHVIGFPSPTASSQLFHIHSLPGFKRLSFTRAFAQWNILRKIISIKPSLLIITTHELIIPAILAKWITGCKVIYDVQENYYRNIFYTGAFPFLFRPLIAGYVRLKEKIAAPLIDHFFLAEKGYESELSFPGKRYTVLENKLVGTSERSDSKRNSNQILFSGTLAETTGIFTAIEIAVKLHALDERITLKIIGHCPQRSVLQRIKNEIASHSFIKLVGGDQLVPHEKILHEIRASAAGIISYSVNPATSNSIPTKLYEYLGFKLPILLTRHPPWVQLCERFKSAYAFDPENIHARAMLDALRENNFYTEITPEVYWQSEEPRLIRQVYLLLQ